jgi:hypothetical protein
MIYSVNSILFQVPDGVTYFEFIVGNTRSVEVKNDLIIFTYIQGDTAKSFTEGLGKYKPIYPDWIIVPYIRPYKITYQSIGINKDKEFIKLCFESLHFTQLIYKINEFKFRNEYYNFIILVPSQGDHTLDEYYNYLESTRLISIENRVDEFQELRNRLVHNSKTEDLPSNRVYLPYSKYRQYRIMALDYLTDFFNKIGKSFEEYGFELVEYEKLKDAKTSNLVTFRINSHTKEFNHRIIVGEPEHDLMFSGSRVSFALMTPDTDIYEDFKARYNNIDIIQNQREFSCEDKYGYPWRYDVYWQSQLDGGFSHEFPQTELSTYGYSFQFTATLEFFDVYDKVYGLMETFLINYVSKDRLNENKYEETWNKLNKGLSPVESRG